MAAAAIVHNIITRSKPREDWPLLPRNKGSKYAILLAMVAREEDDKASKREMKQQTWMAGCRGCSIVFRRKY
jgi:hypothetical protein